MTTGQKLRKIRTDAGLTVAAAATHEGVSKRVWEYWEDDQRLPPSEKEVRTRERVFARLQSLARAAAVSARP